jgi:hypothetical protein
MHRASAHSPRHSELRASTPSDASAWPTWGDTNSSNGARSHDTLPRISQGGEPVAIVSSLVLARGIVRGQPPGDYSVDPIR